jgi:hypothetical protein
MYKKRTGQPQYAMRRSTSEVSLKSFGKIFDKGAYRSGRDHLIREMERQLKKMRDEDLSGFYEKLMGKKPEEIDVKYGITLNPERTVALAPFGTLTKKAVDVEHEKMRKGLNKVLSSVGKKTKAGTMDSYLKRAKNGTVKFGASLFNVEYVISAIRALGKNTYAHSPKGKLGVLVLENENGDKIFIAPTGDVKELKLKKRKR